jgi:RNA 2',3'-cyclic 3'-phosphodiesterase
MSLDSLIDSRRAGSPRFGRRWQEGIDPVGYVGTVAVILIRIDLVVNEHRPEQIRAFVAVYPEAEIVSALESVQGRLRAMLPKAAVKWALPEQIHLTLSFLGNIEEARVADFETALAAASGMASFTLRSTALGTFPNARRPRVLWAGLEGELEVLDDLKTFIDGALEPLGIAPESRDFHPHLTVARIKEIRPAEAVILNEAIADFKTVVFGEWRVRQLDFMQSRLSPAGATYRRLHSVGLRN